MITFPARPASPPAPAPDSLGDDPALTRRWLIETALLWARWGQIPLIALLPVFLRAHPWFSPLLGSLALALGNAGLTRQGFTKWSTKRPDPATTTCAPPVYGAIFSCGTVAAEDAGA